MDLTFSDDELAFRDEFRSWLAENPPPPDPGDVGDDARNAGAAPGSASSTRAAGPRPTGRTSTAAAARP